MSWLSFIMGVPCLHILAVCGIEILSMNQKLCSRCEKWNKIYTFFWGMSLVKWQKYSGSHWKRKVKGAFEPVSSTHSCYPFRGYHTAWHQHLSFENYELIYFKWDVTCSQAFAITYNGRQDDHFCHTLIVNKIFLFSFLFFLFQNEEQILVFWIWHFGNFLSHL